MRLQIKTRVQGNHVEVFKRFDHTLLLQLTPPGMRMELLHFEEPHLPDSCIRIRVTILGLIRQDWENAFSDYAIGPAECHFVDTGRKMPFPMRRWRHDHRVIADGADHAIINDDVTFETGFLLTDWLLRPIIWLQFRYRRPIYRRLFGRG